MIHSKREEGRAASRVNRGADFFGANDGRQGEERRQNEFQALRGLQLLPGVKQKLKVSEVLARAIAKFEERITETDFSPSVADYIKLVQMKKELEETTDEAKEIKVTWVEPVTSDSER